MQVTGVRSMGVAAAMLLALLAGCSGATEGGAAGSAGVPTPLEIDARRVEHGRCPEDLVVDDFGGGPDAWVDPSHPVVAATAVDRTDKPVPDDITSFEGELVKASIAWDRVVRPGDSIPDVGDGSGRLEAISSDTTVEDARFELAIGSEVLVVLSSYRPHLEADGVSAVIALDPDGSAWFLESCGEHRTDSVEALAAREGLNPADYVRARVADPVGFDVTTTVPRQEERWSVPQVNPANPGPGLASVGVHVVAPGSWLTPEGPGTICALTSVGVGECFRLNEAMGGVGDVGAYAPSGTVEDVRVVFLFDGGVPPVDLVVLEQVGFPGVGYQVALGGTLEEPTAEVIRN